MSRLNGVNHLTPESYTRHCYWMQKALEQAAIAGQLGEIPVGAILVNQEQEILSATHNRKEQDHDPTAHAEILAIREASQRLQNWHLESCHLYVTLEPCPMCAGAIIQSRLGVLIYGVEDLKTGSVRTVLNLPDSPASNHRLAVIGGILENDCRQQLQTWFAQKRRFSD